MSDQSGKVSFEVSGHKLIVRNVPAGTVIAVYGIDGCLIEQRISGHDVECFAIDKRGVYVLAIGQEAYKIVL